MKKIGKLVLMMSLIVFSSCSTDEIVPNNEVIESETLETKTTTCNIVGNTSAVAGTTVTYTYTSNFTPNNVTWTITSGGISILSGQGTTTVTVRFSSNFSGGVINALGSGANNISCSENLTISCNGTAPTNVEFDQISGECPGDIFKIKADPNGSTNNGTYTWTAFQGASIVSGQGTNTIRIQSPSSGGFLYRVTFTDDCTNTSVTTSNLAEFDGSCGGGGLGGF